MSDEHHADGIRFGGPATDTECLTEDIVSTATAAHRVGVSVEHFYVWARRRGVTPVHRVRVGRSTVAAWSLSAVLDAHSRRP
ncbi:MAG: hypothetical protein IE926_01835 [Micrococcales bacterium]|nr:hypothetical protein [Micrococcales bacterium]